MLPVSAVTVKVGVVSLVIRSVLEKPVSVLMAVMVGTFGLAVSITIALAPAMFDVPLGTVVDVMEFPAASVTLETMKLLTVRSFVFWLEPTV